MVPAEIVRLRDIRRVTKRVPDSSQTGVAASHKISLLEHILHPEDPTTRLKFILLPPQRIPCRLNAHNLSLSSKQNSSEFDSLSILQ